MAQVKVNVSDLQKLIKKVGSKEAAQQIMKPLAELMLEEVRMNWSGRVPPRSTPGNPPAIDTGLLDRTMNIRPVKDGYSTIARQDYSEHLEYGTYKMAARPFMLPAFERTVAGADFSELGAEIFAET
jgi:hypothetical protein